MEILRVEFHVRVQAMGDAQVSAEGAHDFHELYLVDNGETTLTAPTRTVLHPGDLAWYAAGIPHHSDMLNTSQSRLWYVAWEGDFPLPAPHGVLTDQLRIRSTFAWMFDRWWDGNHACAHQIFAAMLAEISAQSTDDEEAHVLVRVRRYITAHRAVTLSLDRVAAFAGMSPRTLQRRFKESFGLSPIAWHRHHRAQAAYDYLVGSTWSLTRIAQAIDLSGTAALCRLVKSELGVTPQQIRDGIKVSP